MATDAEIRAAARAFVASAFAALREEHVIPTPIYHPYVAVGRDYFGDTVRGAAGYAELERLLDETHPERFAEPLSGRNHSLPLEALRHDITPVGLHYLLTHFDIPEVDAATWRLEVGGLVARPLTLSLEDIRARPARTLAVTLECAGNGRALIEPRPLSQPWQNGAVGTAEWTGTPLAPLLEEASVADDAVEIVFSGLDRGIQREDEHDTSGASRSPRRCGTRCSSPTRSTGSRCRRSTALRFGSSSPAGTG
jgi:DMSO/TMAO reductase YedYZ molybdopterin-dependent catalytic subunit